MRAHRSLRSTCLRRLSSGVQKWQMLRVAKESWEIKFSVDAAVSFKSDLWRHFVANKEAKKGTERQKKNMQTLFARIAAFSVQALFDKCQLQFFQILICLQYRNKYHTMYFLSRHHRSTPGMPVCALIQLQLPEGWGWFGGGCQGVSAVMLGGRRGRRAESPGSQRSLWIPRNSSPPPRLLWEASGACGESEVRRGLSGTKLQIHMICLAKRVKEKWIKAWQDQRSATIESRQLPWDQQEMHIIYKLFSGSVRCARGLIVIVWRKSSCWRGVKSKG